jgi:hypothetical protein
MIKPLFKQAPTEPIFDESFIVKSSVNVAEDVADEEEDMAID